MKNEKNQRMTNETSVGDILDFFMRSWVLIMYWCLAGLLSASVYVALKPNQFEARWNLQLAQYANGNNLGNIEEPQSLVERLSMQTTYSDVVLQACGAPKSGEIGEYLNGKLKVAVIKASRSIVSMRVRAASPDQAKVCANSIVEMVAHQQQKLIEENFAGRLDQLAEYKKSLKEQQRQLLQLKNNGISNFAYLARLDELSWLRGQIDKLQIEFQLSQKHPAKLQAPIYASNEPVSPKVDLIIFLGFLVGLIMGLLHAVARGSLRSDPQKI